MKRDNFLVRPRVCRGRFLAALMVSLLLAACAGPAVRPEQAIQWPPGPLPARVKWVKAISDYRDAGIRKGFWRRMADLVAGESDLRIGRPYGVYTDERGRLFIVDTAFGVVHVMDGKEMTYTIIGGEQKVFDKPIAVTGDDAGNVYITDAAAGAVYRYGTGDGRLSLFTRALERPTGIAFNRNSRLLYVTDTTASQVVIFDLAGKVRFRFGTPGNAPGQFNRPTDLFIDGMGTVYVTDPLNSRIEVFSPDGAFIRAFGRAGDAAADFSKPKGVAVDGEGNIYVCDALFDTVKVFTGSGEFQMEFAERGISPGELWMPSGIYIDKDDYIYVADTYNQRVQVFRHLRPAAQGEKR